MNNSVTSGIAPPTDQGISSFNPLIVGKPHDRVDGRVKVTGAAQYSADIALPELVYGVIFDSAIAKGHILQIDTSEAQKAPGVLVSLLI